ncbi:VOC family protein [Actinomadura latina]|uniref:2,3-dihydroxybiphenyl 1,2-dioxygenase n=1 Tax=Actinomadura latina TaxID=163603 RepID=A0A846Z8X0_9ACTN|nr:VOC family protein [Actinomadura latina]NKZ07204.1 2,3-dihydroxybiphenyl 1,2-dioxygenase [Actinomadura latina]CNG22236.1 glyoxalase/bleomycin resistance protein/dioxygenase [Mycobacterium tuberculosis]
MKEDLQLGYLVIDATDLDHWDRFMRNTIGFMPGPVLHDGTRCYRMDKWYSRFQVQPGERDDVAVIGLVARTPAVLADLRERIEDAGITVTDAGAALRKRRHVGELICFKAPGGVQVEVAASPVQSQVPFHSPAVPNGFLTGLQGLGHAVLMVEDLTEAETFWLDVLGFELSDGSSEETPNGESRAVFLHCNRRHHSIALVRRPERSTYAKNLLHFMIQANEMDAVGLAFDRALDAKLRIPRSLGRHPNDRMFSFYATTPGGFDYEFGWGAVEVDDDWEVAQYDHISAWGHRRLT